MFWVLFSIFVIALIIGYAALPVLWQMALSLSERRSQAMAARLDRVLPRDQVQTLTIMNILAPLGLAVVLVLMVPEGRFQLLSALIGLLIGLLLPSVYTRWLIARNRKKFDDQLVDALMIMSSSFRGGLSLIQAMEAVVEEMPNPINQEFSTVLGENKMGVALDEALDHLYNRMPSPALQQMNTAILLARETGGNLPVIFQRIVNVVREHKRIRGQIETLTIQGRIQGVVMSVLPIAFFFFVHQSNPSYFEHMFRSQLGRVLLLYAALSEMIGVYWIWRICSYKDF